MIFRATFVAVPAFRRVEPVMISGPTARFITRVQSSVEEGAVEAAVAAAEGDVVAGATPATTGTGGLQVMKIVCAAISRARRSAPITNAARPLADFASTQSVEIG